jgi:hypothetical protein
MTLSPIVLFYTGNGTDHAGRYLSTLWNYTDVQLEHGHDFIQWLFPLTTKSQYTSTDPILTHEDIQYFHTHASVRKNMVISFKTMMKFYGFSVIEYNGKITNIRMADTAKIHRWIRPRNHNFNRITRMLTSLHLLGLHDEARAFWHVLSLCIYPTFKQVLGSSYTYWKNLMYN